ncbi:MAG: peptidylprolyl isomerase [Fibrobacter sp.]|jgi:cyclophilin family peptidyl-prolyl cis-trans isomerase|nr:peptidylprolyl isomerase [Fibrobacter sp.]
MFNQLGQPASGETIAVIKTNHGEMRARLFSDIVGEGATNFIELAEQGKYKDVPFHRVIKGFMIQGGDFTNKNGTGGHSAKGPKTTIGDRYDSKLSHLRGALSWAKTAMPNSIGSQFFIVHPEEGTHFLDHPQGGGPAEGYSVFGQLFDGFDVLDSIAGVKTDGRDRPFDDVIIEDVTIEKVP